MPQTIAVYVFRIGSFGDSIVSIPAIKRIRGLNKDARIILITNSKKSNNAVDSWDIFQHIGVFQGVIHYGENAIEPLRLMWKIRTSAASKKVLYYLAPKRNNIQYFRDFIFFKYICGIFDLRGFTGAKGSANTKGSGGRLLRLEKESLRLIQVVDSTENSDISNVNQLPLFFPTQEIVEKVNKILPEKPMKKIIVGFGSNKKSGTWPRENFIILCKMLIEHDQDVRIILVGGAGDFENGESIRTASPQKIYNLCGKTSVIETAAVMLGSSLFVGNDSGPMHLAAAMGVSVIAIFSARDNPGKWEPVGKNYISIRREVPCEGCLLNDCIVEKLRCLTSITVEEVFNTCVKKLDASKYKGNQGQ